MNEYWVCIPHDPAKWRNGGYDVDSTFQGPRAFDDAKEAAGSTGRNAFVLEATFEFSDSELVADPDDCGSRS